MKKKEKADPEKCMEHVKITFEQHDVNKDGKLDLTEFKEMCKAMKEEMKKCHGECVECKDEVEENIFKAYDRSESGLLSFEDVCEGNKRKDFYWARLMEKIWQWITMAAREYRLSQTA